MAKHAPYIHTRYIYVLVSSLYWLDYNNNSSIQLYIHDVVHRARGVLQHFRHYGNCIHFSSVQNAYNTMRLFWDKAHARGAQRCLPVRTFGFSERRVLVRQGVGRWTVRRQ